MAGCGKEMKISEISSHYFEGESREIFSLTLSI
jgi:hypothetical protein